MNQLAVLEIDPAAIVANATRPNQRVILTRLDQVAAEAAAQPIETPALLAVGAVVELGAVLGWFP